MILEEYEKTIAEMISQRERDRVVHEIEREKIIGEKSQTMDDLKSAQSAFNDVLRYFSLGRSCSFASTLQRYIVGSASGPRR